MRRKRRKSEKNYGAAKAPRQRRINRINGRDLIVSSGRSIVPSAANLSLTPKVINFGLFFSVRPRKAKHHRAGGASDVASMPWTHRLIENFSRQSRVETDVYQSHGPIPVPKPLVCFPFTSERCNSTAFDNAIS